MGPRKINELDYVTGEVIRVFNSIREATDFHNIDHMGIHYAIKKNGGYMPIKKLRFEYASEAEVIRKVEQLDYETGECIEVYNSANAAALDNFLTPYSIRLALNKNNGILHKKQLRFRYVD